MYISQRDNDKLNIKLNEIDKIFPVVKKLENIFELSFDSDKKLNIFECCDGFFFEQLSLDDLLELSTYFLFIASLLRTNNLK